MCSIFKRIYNISHTLTITFASGFTFATDEGVFPNSNQTATQQRFVFISVLTRTMPLK